MVNASTRGCTVAPTARAVRLHPWHTRSPPSPEQSSCCRARWPTASHTPITPRRRTSVVVGRRPLVVAAATGVALIAIGVGFAAPTQGHPTRGSQGADGAVTRHRLDDRLRQIAARGRLGGRRGEPRGGPAVRARRPGRSRQGHRDGGRCEPCDRPGRRNDRGDVRRPRPGARRAGRPAGARSERWSGGREAAGIVQQCRGDRRGARDDRCGAVRRRRHRRGNHGRRHRSQLCRRRGSASPGRASDERGHLRSLQRRLLERRRARDGGRGDRP